MSANFPCRLAIITRPIRGGPDIAFESQPALGEKLGQLARVDAEGEPLANLFERREQPLRADVRSGLCEHVAVHVGEYQPAACRGARAPMQSRVDRGVCEIVGDSLPENEAAHRLAVAGSSHARFQITLREI